MRTLIVEDNTEIQVVLRKILSNLGSEVTIAGSIADANAALIDSLPDFILLDVNLPDGDGIKFCATLSSGDLTAGIPFLFISGIEDVPTKLVAFSLGAEDYIVKPFDIVELKARLESRLKKISGQKIARSILKTGNLEIDAIEQRAWICQGLNPILVSLTPREFRILLYLAQNEESVISRNQILERVWGSNSAVFDRNVDTHISSIRRKLGTSCNYIESVQGEGYRFSSKKKPSKEGA